MQEWLADETLEPSIVPKQSPALNAFKTMMKATRAEHPHEVSLIPEELRHDVAESSLEWLAEMEQDDAGASPHRVEQETQVDSDSD